MTDPKATDLDALFTAATSATPAPSDALMARVLADAQGLQPDAPGFAVATPAPKVSFWDIFGGWPAFSGVAAAGVAGLWLGVASPAGIEDLASDVFGTTEAVSFVPEFDDFLGDVIDG